MEKKVLFRHREADVEVYVADGKIYMMKGQNGFYWTDTPERRAYIRVEVKRIIQKYYEEVINRAFEQ